MHYAFPIALIGGFAGFLPYVGAAINYIIIGLVTYFQGSNPYGLLPLTYTIVAIVVALLIDQVHDNLVSPRLMGQTLKVHPAFVLIAAFIAFNLLGILGVVIAAPLLATLQLFGRYTLRKMLDEEPWPPSEESLPPLPMARPIQKLHAWWTKRRHTRPEAWKKPPPGNGVE